MELVSYPALFTPKDGQILVDFPDLPEAFTQGKDMDDAMNFAKLGLAITINDKLGHFEEAPAASDLDQVAADHPEAVVKMVTVDLEEY
ncbi:MAG: type II toxin-antitoxin system HicB family antitoxin [Limosilactobacillus sp.]|uniref:type II toxin-antitoxin system HicB family antitoxin n=1 Tax=Limosilactobacillus sp. TaxID=2773925 RepID=UPI00270C79AC|nr:type II toxin-antitoxin system HicB family antitoxin [Limosilactobacillus sp.]